MLAKYLWSPGTICQSSTDMSFHITKEGVPGGLG